MDIFNNNKTAEHLASKVSAECRRSVQSLRTFGVFNLALVSLTAISGAYVAGNDAGRAFNTFPMMNDRWVPEDILDLRPIWRNFFENTSTVQFDHRILAMTTLTSVGVLYLRAVRNAYWVSFPASMKLAFHGLATAAVLQVSLGITTLLLYVPIPLAAAHQVRWWQSHVYFQVI